MALAASFSHLRAARAARGVRRAAHAPRGARRVRQGEPEPEPRIGQSATSAAAVGEPRHCCLLWLRAKAACPGCGLQELDVGQRLLLTLLTTYYVGAAYRSSM